MGLKVCPLASGSSGNATFVSTGKTSVLIDCGTTRRDLVVLLASIQVRPADLDGILITHAHRDHYKSAGTIHVQFGVPVFVDRATAWAAYRRGGGTSWPRIREPRPIPESIGDLGIHAFDTQHGSSLHGYTPDGRPVDEGRTVGFVLEHRRKRVAVATDIGTITPTVAEALRGVDAMVIEANYDEGIIEEKLSGKRGDFRTHHDYLEWVRSDWGHLSNRQCGEALSAALTGKGRHVYLGHMSVPHADPRMDNNEFDEAVRTVTAILCQTGAPMPHLHRTWRLLAPGKGTEGRSEPLPVADMIEL
jgi:phosphoribosyl 1,2-cyclic phosphodiesterase